MTTPRLPELKPGDPIRAEHLMQVIAAVRAMQLTLLPPLVVASSGPSGMTLALALAAGARFAVTTSIITAAPSANVAGSGTIKLRNRAVAALSDGATGLTCYSNYSTAVASGKRVVVAPEGGDWILLGADCP